MINYKFKKVIVWGHKSPKHTHYHIHFGYYKAFKSMGYDTFWIDKHNNIKDICLNNSLFLTEDQVQDKIPLNKSSFYVLHNCKLSKYQEYGCKYINLENYLNTFKITYNTGNSSLEKINNYTYYDNKSKSLIQPWATDLLPTEFSENIIPLDSKQENINYIGTVWGLNENLINEFSNTCKKNNKNFRNFVSYGANWRREESILKKNVRKIISKLFDTINPSPINEIKARELILNSYIAPDIRNIDHVIRGYIPCRIFKNISYGKIPATNSKYIRDFFCEELPYASDMTLLYEENVKSLSKNSNIQRYNMILQDVKNNHTYLNRIENIFKFIE